MATFIVLASFTDKGIGKVKETIGRAEKFKEMAKKKRYRRQGPLLDAWQP